jgi:beta-carotene ketolase (CrtW type)
MGYGLIALSWLISMIGLLTCDLRGVPWWGLAAAILVRTHLQTGLFILGHDAMHGLLCPRQPGLNHRLGALLLILYAALPYQRALRLHQQHHQAPGSPLDPDGPPTQGSSPLRWYCRFMAAYLSPGQMSGLLAFWASLIMLCGLITPSALLNVLAFCTLPLMLSSVQLFIFGTFLPHRCQQAPNAKPHPESLHLPIWLSLLACFHFGYHREHHDNPGLSWFELPAAHQRARTLAFVPPAM